MIRRIGFIGLGIMGRPMATNLLKAGYTLRVHDVNREPVEALVSLGAEAAAAAREAAGGVDMVITMLPDDAIVQEVVTGPGGVGEGIGKGCVVADMSTISPVTAREIAGYLEAAGAEMLDAPVSGGEVGAIEGSLSIMVGGKEEIYRRALEVFGHMGRNVSYIGGHGAGQVAKAANQIIVGMTIQAVAEALVFAAKCGVDAARVREALLGGFAQSRVLELHGKRMVERDFKPGGKVRSHKKDNEIAVEVAKGLGIYLPGTSVLTQLWNAVAAQGGLDWDHSSIFKVLEAMSGMKGDGN